MKPQVLIITFAIAAVASLTFAPEANAQSCRRNSHHRDHHYVDYHDHHHDRDRDYCDCSRTLGFYGEITCQGMRVEEVVRGSIACRIGLKEGDIILRVDGRRIDCYGDWERAMDRAGCKVCLKVKRCHCGRIDRLHAHFDHCPSRHRRSFH